MPLLAKEQQIETISKQKIDTINLMHHMANTAYSIK